VCQRSIEGGYIKNFTQGEAKRVKGVSQKVKKRRGTKNRKRRQGSGGSRADDSSIYRPIKANGKGSKFYETGEKKLISENRRVERRRVLSRSRT